MVLLDDLLQAIVILNGTDPHEVDLVSEVLNDGLDLLVSHLRGQEEVKFLIGFDKGHHFVPASEPFLLADDPLDLLEICGCNPFSDGSYGMTLKDPS